MLVNFVNFNSNQRPPVNFTAMRKPDFKGFDFAVVEKFKAPIEKFNTNDDLQNWALKKLNEIISRDFGGRSYKASTERKSLVTEWANYVQNENDAYKPTVSLLIMDAITKNLKVLTDKLPPSLNKGVLADTIETLQKKLSVNPREQFDLNKLYNENLSVFYLEDTNTAENITKWIKIPSKKHDSENFVENVNKLRALSHKGWCTKSFNAVPYLSQGDFHVYLENGQPKLGVRFIGAKVREIQGEYNDGVIPLMYYDILKKHLASKKLKLLEDAQKQMDEAAKTAEKYNRIQKDLGDAIKNNDVEKIFNYFGFGCKKDSDGLCVISEFNQPDSFEFWELGIDENKLLEKVKEIEGDACFTFSRAISPGNIEKIGGCADFDEAMMKNLGKLKSIGSFVEFHNSQIKSKGCLEYVGGDIYCPKDLVSLFEDVKVGGEINP